MLLGKQCVEDARDLPTTDIPSTAVEEYLYAKGGIVLSRFMRIWGLDMPPVSR